MLGLLEAYGSDESESESEKEDSSPKVSSPPPSTASRLPNPFELPTPDRKSVFLNSYVEADNAKQALLEKHVKMISTDVRTVNGKKICWNYRNKKCRFGHNCKYAHDSDLQTPGPADVVENKFHQANTQGFDIIEEVTIKASAKKRPGLGETVTPGKKVMKRYYNQKR